MSQKLPVLFSINGTETPLDLSVKKNDMDPSPDSEYPIFSEKSPMRSSSLPHRLDCLNTDSNQRPVFGESMYSDHESFFSLASASSNAETRSSSSPAFIGGSEGHFLENPRPSVSPNFDYESGILPKKRKNLWRPYDSQSKMDETDKDSDSSDSNLSSDHEFRVPYTPPPVDPIKKRKFDMLRYADNQDQGSDMMRTHSPEDHVMFTNDNVIEHDGNRYVPVEADPNDLTGHSGINEALSKAQMSLMNNFPESREKMISGMKKRDIFGWSLKLSSPIDNAGNVTETVHSTDTVCQDGEKTYFELQTVRKSPTSDNAVSESKKDTSKAESSKLGKVSPRSPKSQNKASSPNKNSCQSVSGNADVVQNESTKENRDSLVGKKVFIHGKDNTIESQDETKNTMNKKSDTCKGLSLIDLIEEIEADALKEDKAQSEKERQIKNRRVASLLKQCNHVKLTALDFLMSNVLIEDKDKTRSTKNANIQKMLNGDKISSVSLLDVMEMQVEVGLS